MVEDYKEQRGVYAGGGGSAPAAGPVILVAEDVDSNYLLLQAVIGKLYHLTRAMNGLEAVEMFQSKAPDLILMDLKMPLMDGIEATQTIRKLSAQIPIIALTAYAFSDDRERALEAGCNDFLVKPINPALLKETLKKYLGV